MIRCQIPASLIQAWTMSKHFRPWNIDQTLLLPPNVRDFVPKDHVLAVYRWAGAGESGSQGDHVQLCEWAGPAAVRSAHDGFAFAAWLCKRAVFVAAHC